MKPVINIDDHLISIDTDRYLMTIVLKQQTQVESQEIIKKHRQEINVFRTGEAINSLQLQTPQYDSQAQSKPVVKICPTCGKEFETIFGAQKYCGKDCFPKKEVKKLEPRKCLHCDIEFIPKLPFSKFCCLQCSKNHWYHKHKKPSTRKVKKKIEPLNNPKAAFIDNKRLEDEKKVKQIINSSPDLSTKIPVKIDAKTTIFVNPGEDIKQARQNFIKKHNQFERDKHDN
jgi:hypothetical protein